MIKDKRKYSINDVFSKVSIGEKLDKPRRILFDKDFYFLIYYYMSKYDIYLPNI